jgi:carbonic anhydrase
MSVSETAAVALPGSPGIAEVFAGLVDGLARFTNQAMIHPHEQWRDRDLSKKQAPPICVLACADSRVPPEIVFDQGLGDMFVVRVAGNLADEDDQASIEYAIQHFDPPPAIILVMGHENCGAVTAATIIYDQHSVPGEIVNRFRARGTPSPNLQSLVSRLQHAIERTKWTDPDPGQWSERLDHAVVRNIRDNVAILRANAVIAQNIRQHRTFVVGARYGLDQATVEWMVPLPAWPGAFGDMANDYCLEINPDPNGAGTWLDVGTLTLDAAGTVHYRSGMGAAAADSAMSVVDGFFDPQSGRLFADHIPDFRDAGNATFDVKITNGNVSRLYWGSEDKCSGWCLTGSCTLRAAQTEGGRTMLLRARSR